MLKHLYPEHVEVEPRWLWHALDHHSRTGLAYVFRRRKDAVFFQRHALLEPFGITRFSPMGGKPTSGISTQPSPSLANSPRRLLTANISIYGRG